MAGSRVVPITTIGAAPSAWIAGRLLLGARRKALQEVRAQANTLPKTGEAFSKAG